MEKKYKKTLLDLIIITAIAMTIISLFLPIICIDYSDVYKNEYNEEPDKYAKLENSILLWHYAYYDLSNPEEPYENHQYRLFNIIKFETGKPIDIQSNIVSLEEREFLTNNGDFFFSTNIAIYIYMAFIPIGLAVYIYLCYKGIKNIGIKRTKYFLYLALLSVIIFIVYIVGNYFFLETLDIRNIGYSKHMTTGDGFITGLISVTLFFIAYVTQQYFIKIDKNSDKYTPE